MSATLVEEVDDPTGQYFFFATVSVGTPPQALVPAVDTKPVRALGAAVTSGVLLNAHVLDGAGACESPTPPCDDAARRSDSDIQRQPRPRELTV